MEAMERILEAENEAAEIIRNARRDARKLVSDAEEKSELKMKLFRDERKLSENRIHDEAEREAAVYRSEILEEALEEAKRIENRAKPHMEEAADYIVERIRNA